MAVLTQAKIKVLSSMLIFGTIGLVVRSIPLPSATIAMMRGVIGTPFLCIAMWCTRKRINFYSMRENAALLFVSSIMLGVNWLLLFESYCFTTIAAATLCYYFAPLLLVLFSPLFFRERITRRKILCVLAALAGMYFVSGPGGTAGNGGSFTGIILALAAAVLYAFIVIANKKLKNIGAYDKTIVQLMISALVLLTYNLASGNLDFSLLDSRGLIMLLVAGVLHTGVAYLLYFGSTQDLPSQSLAILSYIDPVTAVLLSALLLNEPFGIGTLIGAVLILGAAIVSEIPERTA